MHLLLFLFLLLLLLDNAACSSMTPEAYRYRSYEEMVKAMRELASRHPESVELMSAQERYGLPSPGKCGPSEACEQWILRISNRTNPGLEERPQVFLSGEIHGDERVGPQAMLELAKLLVEHTDNDWIRRLLNSREVFIMPMTNAIGYYQKVRGENRIDTNRDYPIDNPRRECMRTITSRTINELFRENMFQLALTFHGGMQAIAFEWGTKTHDKNDVSPDDIAQLSLGSIMSAYAGTFQGKAYPFGRMNDLVYSVYGGMEDWAYAGSWDKVSLKGGDLDVKGCDSYNYGGYDKSKTVYSSSQLRAINILVETSDDKTPVESTLGTNAQILKPGGIGDGHVPRNIRLGLVALEFVAPYIQWVPPSSSNNEVLSRLCAASVKESSFTGFVSLGWEVGGSVKVDQTELVWGLWPSKSSGFNENEEGFGLSDATLENIEWKGMSMFKQSGLTRWAGGNIPVPSKFRRHRHLRGGREADSTISSPGFDVEDVMKGKVVSLDEKYSDREVYPFVAQWIDCMRIRIDDFDIHSGGIDIFVMARARVDSAWGLGSLAPNSMQEQGDPHPQSHLVNARTNPSWNMTNNGHMIKGKLRWYSKPIRLHLSRDTESCPSGTQNFRGGQQRCVDFFYGLPATNPEPPNEIDQVENISAGIHQSDLGYPEQEKIGVPWFLFFLACLIGIFTYKSRGESRMISLEASNQAAEEETRHITDDDD